MAPYVGRMWVVAGRGGTHPGVLDAMAALDNVRLTGEPVGHGWAEAVRDAVAG
jgi:hypothetical protein